MSLQTPVPDHQFATIVTACQRNTGCNKPYLNFANYIFQLKLPAKYAHDV